MTKRKREEFTPAEKLRYVSMVIEEIVRMNKEKKKFKPRTSFVAYACQYTSSPKLKPEDFEAILNMSLKDIIRSEIDIPLTTKEFEIKYPQIFWSWW